MLSTTTETDTLRPCFHCGSTEYDITEAFGVALDGFMRKSVTICGDCYINDAELPCTYCNTTAETSYMDEAAPFYDAPELDSERNIYKVCVECVEDAPETDPDNPFKLTTEDKKAPSFDDLVTREREATEALEKLISENLQGFALLGNTRVNEIFEKYLP